MVNKKNSDLGRIVRRCIIGAAVSGALLSSYYLGLGSGTKAGDQAGFERGEIQGQSEMKDIIARRIARNLQELNRYGLEDKAYSEDRCHRTAYLAGYSHCLSEAYSDITSSETSALIEADRLAREADTYLASFRR